MKELFKQQFFGCKYIKRRVNFLQTLNFSLFWNQAHFLKKLKKYSSKIFDKVRLCFIKISVSDLNASKIL